VASPARIIDFLARYELTLDNLDGYPLLEHYVRYRIHSAQFNDRLISGFRKMPREFYALSATDHTPRRLRRPGESHQAAVRTDQEVWRRMAVTQVEETTAVNEMVVTEE
jgi:hypothetical protein